MGIGGSVLLLVVGLILALAVHVSVSGLDLQVVGWIMVAAGALGLALNVFLFAPRRRRTVVRDRAAVVDPVAVVDPAVVDPGLRYGSARPVRSYPAGTVPPEQVVRERVIDEGPL